MATLSETNRAYDEWREHCKRIQSFTDTTTLARETDTERDRRIARLRRDYGAFCEYYFPHFLSLRDSTTGEVVRVIHNAPFHNEAARKIKSTPNLKAVFKWPRGHAKSTHMDIFVPLWLMFQNKPLIHFMVLVGKSEDAGRRLLSDILAELEFNQRILSDFGNQKSVGDWTDGEFTTEAGIHFLGCGRGQSPRGLRNRESRPDYIVIDDLDDDELCRNPSRVREMTDWVTDALFGSLDVGRGRFIMVGNLIGKVSVLAAISAKKGVFVSTIYAVDKNGEPTWKEKWTRKEAEDYAEFVGYRSWQKEMMHNPITEGSVFKNEWIRYKKMLPLHQYDAIVCYTDPSWKPKTSNDYKASRMWGKKGKELHLIWTFVRQATTGEMVRALYDLYESLPENISVRFYMEAIFLQDMILDEFEAEGERRGYQLPISGDYRKKPDKLQRITDISPLWERGYVFYNEDLKDTPDMRNGIDQTLALEKGSTAHDDAPDADEGAIWYLQRTARQTKFTPRMGNRPSAKNIF